MLHVGARRIVEDLAFASSARKAPTRCTSSGSNVDARAVAQGRHCALQTHEHPSDSDSPPSWGRTHGDCTKCELPRTPLGPSLIRTLGMFNRGIVCVFHQLGALRSSIFSLTVILRKSLPMSASRRDRSISVCMVGCRRVRGGWPRLLSAV
jgi:hypothetical protein